jgi:hypothetical protein
MSKYKSQFLRLLSQGTQQALIKGSAQALAAAEKASREAISERDMEESARALELAIATNNRRAKEAIKHLEALLLLA